MRRLVAALAIALLVGGASADDRLDAERQVRRSIASADRTAIERLLAVADARDRARLEIAFMELELAAGPPRIDLVDRIVAARADLLAFDDDPRVAAWRVDQAEALLLVRPSLDGGHLFPRVGFLSDAEAARLAEVASSAERLLAAPSPDIDHPLLALDRTVRRPMLAALLAALKADLAVRVGRSPPKATLDEELLAKANELPPPARDAVRLAVARVRAGNGAPGVAVAEPIDAMRRDRTTDRTALGAGEALLALVAAERGEQSAAREALLRLESASERGDVIGRLLVADALFRVESMRRLAGARDADPTAAWIRLDARADDAQRIALRGAILQRIAAVGSTPAAPERASILELVAFADALRERDAETLATTLRAKSADLREPGRRIARFELGRTLAHLRRYAESAEVFRSFANDFPDDPLAVEALDLALEIARPLADGVRADDPRAIALRALLDLAIERYAFDRRRAAWRIEAAELALAAGESERAIALATAVAPTDADAPRARLIEAESLLRQGAQDAARIAALIASAGDRASKAGDAARRALVLAGLALSRGDAEEAIERADDAIDAALPLPASERRMLIRTAVARSLAARSARADPVVVPVAALALGPELAPPLLAHARRVVADLDAARAAGDPRPFLRGEGARLLGDSVAVLAPLLERPPRDLDAPSPGEWADILLAAGAAEAALAPARAAYGAAPADPAAALRYAEALRRGAGGDAALRDEPAAIAREVQRRAERGSAAWWEAELLIVRLLAVDPASRAGAAARINRARLVDADLGGPRYRPFLEAAVVGDDGR